MERKAGKIAFARRQSSQNAETVWSNEALREVAQDIEEGADIVMVKPGLPYLDIIFRVKDTFGMPTFASWRRRKRGYIDGDKAMLESLICLERAGAVAILTYFAPRVAKYLKEMA